MGVTVILLTCSYKNQVGAPGREGGLVGRVGVGVGGLAAGWAGVRMQLGGLGSRHELPAAVLDRTGAPACALLAQPRGGGVCL